MMSVSRVDMRTIIDMLVHRVHHGHHGLQEMLGQWRPHGLHAALYHVPYVPARSEPLLGAKGAPTAAGGGPNGFPLADPIAAPRAAPPLGVPRSPMRAVAGRGAGGGGHAWHLW